LKSASGWNGGYGDVYRDNGHDLAISTQPAQADSSFAIESRPDSGSIPEWVSGLRNKVTADLQRKV